MYFMNSKKKNKKKTIFVKKNEDDIPAYMMHGTFSDNQQPIFHFFLFL
jgi:hypothetical protein